MKAGIQGFNGSRLRQAREALGLKLGSLADMVGVTKQSISQYELNESSPGPEVFDRIKVCLRQDHGFFLQPIPGFDVTPRFFRSMASANRTARLRAEARLLLFREILSNVSERVEFPAVDFPDLFGPGCDPQRLTMEEIEAAAMEMRRHWGLGDGPVANLVDVAESRGCIVLRHGLDSAALDAVSQWATPEARPLVVLNSDKNVAVRSRLDLGHELGHMAVHRHLSVGALEDPECFELIEAQAFRFGAALLLPEKPFLEDLFSVSLDALRSLKAKWKVSIAMMIERLKALQIIDLDQHRRLRINYNARKWMTVEPFDRELPVEEPQVMNKAIRLLASRNIDAINQIAANTGINRQWIEQITATPLADSSDSMKLKLVEPIRTTVCRTMA